ncbi:hypothetical protein GCM10028819_10030 [Spirosoma humi]
MVSESNVLKHTLDVGCIWPTSRVCFNDYKSETKFNSKTLTKDDTCKIVASTFQVQGLQQRPLFLEQVADNKILCQSVNREMNEVVNSLSAYIHKNTDKPW